MKLGPLLLAFPAIGLAIRAPQEDKKPPEPLKHGSLAYYQDHCARCHGEMGGAYPDDFTKDKTAQELRDVVTSMAAGQGGAPLTTEAEIEAQVAFHYAMDQKKPFLTWTGQDGTKLTGEVTPGAKVSGVIDGVELPVKVEKGIWTIVLPTTKSVHEVILTTPAGHAKAILDLGKRSFSQIEP